MKMTIETKKQIENTVYDMLKTAMFDDEIPYLEIKSLEVFGSRLEGTHREDSDLDIKIEYTDNIKESEVFNMLNTLGFNYNGLVLDFFPVQVEENNEEVVKMGITEMMKMYDNAFDDIEGDMYEEYLKNLEENVYDVSARDVIKTIKERVPAITENELELQTISYLLDKTQENNKYSNIKQMMDMYSNAWEDYENDVFGGEAYIEYLDDLKNKEYKVPKEGAIKILKKMVYNITDNDLEIRTILYLLNKIQQDLEKGISVKSLKAKTKELHESLEFAMNDVISKKEEIEKAVDSIHNVHLFYERNNMRCKYDLDELYDEVLFGTLEKQLKLNKTIDLAINLMDSINCDLVKAEEQEEVIKIKETLEQCIEKIDHKHNFFWSISEYIDSVGVAQKMLQKIYE